LSREITDSTASNSGSVTLRESVGLIWN